MRKWSHFEDNKHGRHMIAAVDGYDFGDRLLEGVFFLISIQSDGTLKAEVEESSKGYMEDLNETKWLNTALRYAEKNDLFYRVNEVRGRFKVMKSGDNELVLFDTDGKLSSDNGKTITPIDISKAAMTGIQFVEKIKRDYEQSKARSEARKTKIISKRK